MAEFNTDVEQGLGDLKKGLDVLKIHRRYIYIIVALVTLLICSVLFMKCEHQKEVDNLVKNISTYHDSAQHYKSKYGQVAFNKSLQFENQEQLKSYLSNNDTIKNLLKNFKKINSVTITKEKIYIHDTVPIYFSKNNIIPCDFKPFKITRDTTWYHFIATIHRDRFNIDSIQIPNKQTISIGYKRINLFKKEQRVEVINSNPYIMVSNVGGYVICDKNKLYQRPFFTFISGIFIGATVVTIKNLGKK